MFTFQHFPKVLIYLGFHKQWRLHTRCMSKSAIIEETKDDVSMTDEDMNNEPVVDLGQLDPVSILIYSADITLYWSLIAGWVSVTYT